MGKKNILLLVFPAILLMCGFSFAQEKTIIPNLSKINNEDYWGIYNRVVSSKKVNGKPALYLNGQEGDGFVWLKDFEFDNGIIEADIKGKNVQGNSFVGIAFHGVDDTTYEVVYFRPFNFMSEDSVRKAHAVQYISHPVYTWYKLRKEHPGKYENTMNPVPDPNSFFHAKIIVEKPKVSVFVNNAEEPSLVVNELSERTGGWVGLWTGNYSDGTFSNLKIVKKEK
ncbi:MAG: hypothetical protein P8Z35_00340 [Ignavibacteriaceae bacterium]|jgi:hypothetical protein